jgi:hypothetical protein
MKISNDLANYMQSCFSKRINPSQEIKPGGVDLSQSLGYYLLYECERIVDMLLKAMENVRGHSRPLPIPFLYAHDPLIPLQSSTNFVVFSKPLLWTSDFTYRF